eukprot:scaffold707_cov399-Prasinococcus_capsulatus_cf.AAC.21
MWMGACRQRAQSSRGATAATARRTCWTGRRHLARGLHVPTWHQPCPAQNFAHMERPPSAMRAARAHRKPCRLATPLPVSRAPVSETRTGSLLAKAPAHSPRAARVAEARMALQPIPSDTVPAPPPRRWAWCRASRRGREAAQSGGGGAATRGPWAAAHCSLTPRGPSRHVRCSRRPPRVRGSAEYAPTQRLVAPEEVCRGCFAARIAACVSFSAFDEVLTCVTHRGRQNLNCTSGNGLLPRARKDVVAGPTLQYQGHQ